MSLTDVLPGLKSLNRFEKIRVVQILINEIAKEEESFFENGKQYPIWSPFESYEAAEGLMKLLEEEKQKNA